MRAAAINAYGGPERIEILDLPDPKVGPDTVRIAVRAASVNPVDWKVREGYLDAAFPVRFPLILGWDAAGVVEAVGPAVVDLEPGDEVFTYARKTEVGEGTYAELLSIPAGAVARKPRSATWAQAAALPLAGLTAYQALVDALRLERGETVLVLNAAGGVGHLAVQIAVALGATVVGTASERNDAFVRGLGAAQVVDYSGDVAGAVRERFPDGVDAVLDLVGEDALTAALGAVRPGGRAASVTTTALPGDRTDVAFRYVFVRPSAAELDELARLVDEGLLVAHVAETYPLAEAAVAQIASAEGHVRGKVVIEMTAVAGSDQAGT